MHEPELKPGRVASDDPQDELERLASIGAAVPLFLHSISNVLNNIHLKAQLLQRRIKKTPESGDLDDTATNLIDTIHQLASLLSDIRGAARVGAEENVRFDMCGLLREVAEDLSRSAATALVKVQLDFPTGTGCDLCAVWGQPGSMKRMLLNLCTNSIEAMPDGGVLTLSVLESAGYILIEVRDTGVGPPLDFDPLSPFTTLKVRAAGLGLSIARQIAISHHGSLSIGPAEAGGSIVKIIFPSAKFTVPCVHP